MKIQTKLSKILDLNTKYVLKKEYLNKCLKDFQNYHHVCCIGLVDDKGTIYEVGDDFINIEIHETVHEILLDRIRKVEGEVKTLEIEIEDLIFN